MQMDVMNYPNFSSPDPMYSWGIYDKHFKLKINVVGTIENLRSLWLEFEKLR